jgi:hexulose-6-phosphate isomerase
MSRDSNRREFLAASGAAAVGLSLAGRAAAAESKTAYLKALIGKPTEATLAGWKAAGFQGMECRGWNTAPDEAKKGRALAEAAGMRLHSVMRGWANFNQPAKVKGDLDSVKTALAATQAFGGDAVLLVPCRVGGMAMPEPWEFDIEFDEATGHVTRVAQGDNGPYEAYIQAQNESTDASRRAIEQLIPTAEKTGVVIALENVWNNLWVQPDLFAHFIASFESPWVQCYFDIGNHVKYAPPEAWIRALGKLIVRCHVKDFKLNDDGHGGKFCNIREGSVNWPVVMQELDKLGKEEMWMTIEGSGGLSVEERSRRLDDIIAGK